MHYRESICPTFAATAKISPSLLLLLLRFFTRVVNAIVLVSVAFLPLTFALLFDRPSVGRSRMTSRPFIPSIPPSTDFDLLDMCFATNDRSFPSSFLKTRELVVHARHV